MHIVWAIEDHTHDVASSKAPYPSPTGMFSMSARKHKHEVELSRPGCDHLIRDDAFVVWGFSFLKYPSLSLVVCRICPSCA